MSIVLDGLTLPSGLIWVDEFDWSPIQQSTARSVAGSLFVDSGTKTKGRPIRLQGEDNAGWIDRIDLVALYAKLDLDIQMVLTLEDARVFDVKFDHANTAIQSDPIIDYELAIDEDNYTLAINLITV